MLINTIVTKLQIKSMSLFPFLCLILIIITSIAAQIKNTNISYLKNRYINDNLNIVDKNFFITYIKPYKVLNNQEFCKYFIYGNAS